MSDQAPANESEGKKRKYGKDSDNSSDEEEEAAPAGAGATSSLGGQSKEDDRREKRLALNRESARVRRRRKKIQMETLEKRAEDLTVINEELRATNEALANRVAQLEIELAAARNSSSTNLQNRPGASSFESPLQALRWPSASATRDTAGFLDERAALQRQLALSNRSFHPGLGATQFGGSLTGPSGTNLASNSELQYMQFLSEARSRENASRGISAVGDSAAMLGNMDSFHRAQILQQQQQQQQFAAGHAAMGHSRPFSEAPNSLQLPGFGDLRRLEEMGRIRAVGSPSILDVSFTGTQQQQQRQSHHLASPGRNFDEKTDGTSEKEHSSSHKPNTGRR